MTKAQLKDVALPKCLQSFKENKDSDFYKAQIALNFFLQDRKLFSMNLLYNMNQLSPNNPFVHEAYSRIYLALGFPLLSENSLKSFQGSPDFFFKLSLSKNALDIQNKQEGFLVEYSSRLKESKDSNPKPEEFCDLLFASNKNEATFSACQAAVQANPSNSGFLEKLGTTAFLLRDINTAMISLKKAYEINPKSELAQNNYAVVLILYQDYDNALKILKDLIN